MPFTVDQTSRCAATEHAIEAWVERGDEGAAAWIVSHYRPAVESVVTRLPLWWQQQDALQDTFARAFSALHCYEPRSPFAHWLAVIAKNVCHKHLRMFSRRAPHLLMPAVDEVEEALRSLPCRTMPPDEILSRSELCNAAWYAVESLPDFGRRLFERYAVDGEPAAEVAADLGMTPGAVRVSVSRTRQALQQRLHHESEAIRGRYA